MVKEDARWVSLFYKQNNLLIDLARTKESRSRTSVDADLVFYKL